MHDPRVGRFFATDPLELKYPWYSPYQFSGNRTIDAVELEGREEKIVWYSKDSKRPIVTQMNDKNIKRNTDWTRQQVIFYKTVLDLEKGGAKWSKGKNNYHFSYSGDNSMIIKGRDDIWNGHLRGTLTIRETNNGYELSFDSTPLNQKINYKTDWALTKKAVKALNPIYPVPDPSIEGSEEYANTVNNYKTGVMLPLAVESLTAQGLSKLDLLLTSTSIALDIDEIAGCGDESSYISSKLNNKGNAAFNMFKAIIDGIGRGKSIDELPNSQGGTQTVKNAADAIKGTTDLINDFQSIPTENKTP